VNDAIVVWRAGAPTADGWSASAAPGADARVAADGGALRLDFALPGPASWAIARRALDAALPAHWVLALRVRGAAPPNELQVKLVDPAGTTVWWWRLPDHAFSVTGEALVLRRAALDPAWGPESGADPERLGAVEIAIAAKRAGAGSLWLDDVRIEPRTVHADAPRVERVRASSASAGRAPEAIIDGDVGWRPAPADPAPWLELDLGEPREWGGLVVEFADATPRTRTLASDDGARWQLVAEDAGDAARRRWLRTGDVESRYVRLELPAGDGGGLARVEIVPLALALAPTRFTAAVARARPRGELPRHLLGEQAHWAVVGADGDERKALLSEDGALEVDAESFTLEPFLALDDRVLSWADVETDVSLLDGSLPIPSVEWVAGAIHLRVTAFAIGETGKSALVARYAVRNAGATAVSARLVVAVRPFQVTPAWQRLNIVPVLAPIGRIDATPVGIRVDEARDVVAVTAADAWGAGREAIASDGTHPASLAPGAARADDPLGFAAAALAYTLRLAPGAGDEVVVAVPLHPEAPALPAALPRADAAAWCAERLRETSARWSARLAALPIALPESARTVADTLRASVAWILVNRDGPRIQPGPRCYRRSWIRDGALTATALAEMGLADEARAFVRWYAPHQLPDGRVPCAVDRRGVDPTVEHDSHGQLVWAVVALHRLTGDDAFLRELWPRVRAAVDALAALRAERNAERFRGTGTYGLLPESISHEGYASRPVHSYWDDFFALRAFGDAADAARVVGDDATAARAAALRDAFRADLHASIAETMALRAIDYVPGAVELGDFDPTSTAIVFDPCDEDARLPRAALDATFARYWGEVEGRAESPPDAYSPYEVRNVVALLRLGWKDRALGLLARLLADQRPAGWRQWPEIAWRDPRAPRFLGDLPHGWVASTFVRAVRRLFADERDGTLVLAAGVPAAWVRDGPGISARGLPTRFGRLDLTLRAAPDGDVHATVGGDLREPPGGVVLVSPDARPLRAVRVDGRPVAIGDPARVRLPAIPAAVVLSYRAPRSEA
jgi:hypothetical protein